MFFVQCVSSELEERNTRLLICFFFMCSCTRFAEWIAQNLHALPGQEVWFVASTWSLLIETERRVPLAEIVEEGDNARKDHPRHAWREKTMEFLEFDTTVTRVLSLWRMILDYTGDSVVVSHTVQALQHILKQAGTDSEAQRQWQTIVLKKMQPHFVDIADVLIGWAMSASPRSSLR